MKVADFELTKEKWMRISLDPPVAESLHQTLQVLVAEASALPPASVRRQQILQKLYRRVMAAKKLWVEHEPYYGDALQDMWEYCFQHLDEYDPAISGVTTWLNFCLKKQLRQHRDRWIRERDHKANPHLTDEDEWLDPVDSLPARPAIEPTIDILETTLHWVKTDPEGTLRATCFRKRSEINAQALFLLRFPDETPWQAIADRFDLNLAEAKDLPKFYNRHCLPLLRNFGYSQGYITNPALKSRM
jgi:hypothetical protein